MIPRNAVDVELSRFETLVVDAQRTPDCRRGVHDDHRRAARIRVDVHEPFEPYVEAALFVRLPDRSGCERLAAVDVSAGKHPLAVSRLDGAAHQNDPVARELDDGSDSNLRIEIEDEA